MSTKVCLEQDYTKLTYIKCPCFKTMYKEQQQKKIKCIRVLQRNRIGNVFVYNILLLIKKDARVFSSPFGHMKIQCKV